MFSFEVFEAVITRYGVIASSVVLGSGATVIIWKKAARPAFHAAVLFVKRTNALFDKVDHALSPNGGNSLVDLVGEIRPNHESAEYHWKGIELNLLNHQTLVLQRLDQIDQRFREGDERMGRIEEQIAAGVITIQEGQ